MTTGYTGVFTGRQYRGRPVGYAEWEPRGDEAALLGAAYTVLETLAADDLVPVGPRAVGYRLLGHGVGSRTVVKDRGAKDADGNHLYPARSAARQAIYDFSHVGDVLNKGRRAGRVPWRWVADTGATSSVPPPGFDAVASVREVVMNCEDYTAAYPKYVSDRLDRAQLDIWADQPVRVELWFEAADLMQLAARITAGYGVPTFSAKGWNGPVPVREAGMRWRESDRPVEVLYLGDYDPDGIQLAERTMADALAFTNGIPTDYPLYREIRDRVAELGGPPPVENVSIQRIGVTPEQVETWSIPHEPGKASHRNDFTCEIVAQCEAIPPHRLRDLLKESIGGAMDLDVLAESRERWSRELEELRAELLGADED